MKSRCNKQFAEFIAVGNALITETINQHQRWLRSVSETFVIDRDISVMYELSIHRKFSLLGLRLDDRNYLLNVSLGIRALSARGHLG